MKNNDMLCCIYLRKSRADREAEMHGEGETLARHEKILLDLAKRLGVTIGAIYREVVSGETISARPQMQILLSEVESGNWDGVLVVEVERLARGDTIDQGIVSRAFQLSGTKIITPTKVYDPDNEFDEEYFEFGLFMSRREYKTIRRRLNAGRISSVNEGKYVGNRAPYGYVRVKLPKEKGFTLEPEPTQAPIVKMIFDWYGNGIDGERLGVGKIVRKLNDLGIPPLVNKTWSPATVQCMLSNPIYIGKIRWNARKTVKKVVDGKVVKQRPRAKDYIVVDGLHPAIVSEELFEKVQVIRSKNPPRPQNSLNVVRNPLAGIIACSKCGRNMVRRPYNSKQKVDTLICQNTACKQVASPLWLVEQCVLDQIRDIVQGYELSPDKNEHENTIPEKETLLESKKQFLDQLMSQKSKQYDLLEQGIYTTEIFIERSDELKRKIDECNRSIDEIKSEIERETQLSEQRDAFIPRCKELLANYDKLSVSAKNEALRELIDHVIYNKDVKNKKGHANDITFTLDIFPRIK